MESGRLKRPKVCGREIPGDDFCVESRLSPASSQQPRPDLVQSPVSPAMSYVILGRAIKNEYLALGTIFGAVGLTMLATGGKKEAPAPKTLEQAKETVKVNASSNIKNFIAEAEKESKH
ncbi:hypothetical protein PYCCODRAFT_1463393 [Trametes coccinea BRFM310]|uniref:ATP synthase subunit K, mitochondrial n=1 Tax=Trametes coccinea (strain BRFM310) TaxID=1353009 RepID=A0A1Y2J5T2_TRAC3|nr:hypothetical protein PYCCODRAFT_1463393 [Trametes coccinea BRFM310]